MVLGAFCPGGHMLVVNETVLELFVRGGCLPVWRVPPPSWSPRCGSAGGI